MRNTAKAQEGQIENIDDGMWKVIHQEANVTDEYKAPIEYDVISSTRTKNVIYETESYDCSYVQEHPVYYQMIDNKGSSHGISSNTYYRLAHLSNTPLIFIDMHRKYHTKEGNIKEYEWDQNILNLVNITPLIK